MTTKKETKKEIKKTTVKKPVTKKVEEVKKVEKKKEKISLKERTKNFFNSPQPLFVIFIIIIIGLLVYIVQYSKHDSIMIGTYNSDQGSIGTIHSFTNHKINVFYATPVNYTGEDKKIYAYDIGYYYESGDELKPFLVRTGKSDTALSLKQVISQTSSWNISELASVNSYFSDEIMNNLDKLHFIVYASTVKDSDLVDHVVDFKIEVDKLV